MEVDRDFHRICIVKFGYDVHFMLDVTSVHYEHGYGRITPCQTRSDVSKHLFECLFAE